MGRKKNDKSAICPFCNKDFTLNKNRYRDLDYHMEHIHKNSQVVNYNNFIICNVGKETILDILKNTDFHRRIEEAHDKYMMSGNDEDRLVVGIYKLLHCNPEHPEYCNIVIPNTNKNEVLVKVEDGVKKMTKNEGVQLAIDTFYKDEAPEIDKVIPTFNMTAQSEKKYGKLDESKAEIAMDDIERREDSINNGNKLDIKGVREAIELQPTDLRRTVAKALLV